MSGKSILSTIKEVWEVVTLGLSIIAYSGTMIIIGEEIREKYFYPFIVLVGVLILLLAIRIYQKKEEITELKSKLEEMRTNADTKAINATYHIEKVNNQRYRCTVIVNLKEDMLQEKSEVNKEDLSLTKIRIISKGFKLENPSGIKPLEESDGTYFEYKLDVNPNSIIKTYIFSFTIPKTSQRQLFLKITHIPTSETYALNIALDK